MCHQKLFTIQVIRRLLPEQESCKIVQIEQGMVLLIKLIPLTVQRYVKAITAMSSLNLDEGRAMGVTMLLAHSVWGIVAPEISVRDSGRVLQGKVTVRDLVSPVAAWRWLRCALTSQVAVAQWPWVRASATPGSCPARPAS